MEERSAIEDVGPSLSIMGGVSDVGGAQETAPGARPTDLPSDPPLFSEFERYMAMRLAAASGASSAATEPNVEQLAAEFERYMAVKAAYLRQAMAGGASPATT